MKFQEDPNGRRPWINVVAICLTLLLAPTLARPIFFPSLFASASTNKTNFNSKPIAKLNSLNPELVFIGNSMLETRIDSDYLSKLLNGKRVLLLSDGGILSAHWYLILKNYILASKVLPKSVFVFYRDTVLTEPELRTTGAYRTKTERLQLDQEPEFRKIAIERCQPTLHSDTNRYSHLFPLVQFRDKANLIINNTALSFALVSSDQRPQFLAKVNKIFHYAELRSDLVGDDLGGLDNEITKKTFRESLNCSFLPLIIELCKTHGMKLNFIRVQKRPTIKGAAKRSAALVAYLKDLDSYLEGAGVGTFDLTGDPKIRLRWYADGDHIAPKYKQEYTRHFFELFYKEFYDIS